MEFSCNLASSAIPSNQHPISLKHQSKIFYVYNPVSNVLLVAARDREAGAVAPFNLVRFEALTHLRKHQPMITSERGV